VPFLTYSQRSLANLKSLPLKDNHLETSLQMFEQRWTNLSCAHKKNTMQNYLYMRESAEILRCICTYRHSRKFLYIRVGKFWTIPSCAKEHIRKFIWTSCQMLEKSTACVGTHRKSPTYMFESIGKFPRGVGCVQNLLCPCRKPNVEKFHLLCCSVL
jgi:hypothetical protein